MCAHVLAVFVHESMRTYMHMHGHIRVYVSMRKAWMHACVCAHEIRERS